ELPEAVRESTTSRRLVRLFGALDRQSIETRQLGGGLHDGGRDRRFHWTCETPCRFDFVFPHLPAHFVAGIASPEPVRLRVRLGADGAEAPLVHLAADKAWHDLWMEGGATAGAPGTIVLEIDSEAPALVFVGGIGPAPSAEEEATREGKELAYRVEALEHLELRWKDDVAHLYENQGALGEAVFAERVVSVADRDAAFGCVAEHPGQAVACVPRAALPARDLPRGGPASLEITASDPGSLRIRTASETSNLLLISRLFDPGWRATIDGSPASLLPANGALQALAVPEGAHEVEIYYSPGSVGLGLALSLLSLGLLAGLLWIRPERRAGV
ncbi:MAG: hypothetical protein P8R42_12260, partial [Candidatus Binatia bacterium]|nr:hypothetical protein [Candidatus Binatia bacterium]